MAQIALYDGVVGAYAVGQITDTDYQPNAQHAVARYSGGLSPQLINIIQGDPVISITTQDLYTLIGAVSATDGLAVASGTITIPWRARAAGGTYSGGSAHYTLSSANGLLIPTEFGADQDSEEGATAKLELYPASTTGLLDPVAINNAQALASQNFVAAYDLGPFKLSGTTFTQVQSVRVMFGITCERKRFNGETWAKMSGITINLIDPTMEVTFMSAEDLETFDHYGALATTAVAFFRKRSDGGTHVADATAEHIACTITGGTHILKGASGSKQDDATLTRTIVGKSLAFSRTSAIS